MVLGATIRNSGYSSQFPGRENVEAREEMERGCWWFKAFTITSREIIPSNSENGGDLEQVWINTLVELKERK